MKNSSLILASSLLIFSLNVTAQNSVRIPDPMSSLTKAERKLLENQAEDFFDATKPAVAKASQSTVSITHKTKRLALGTAISEDGKILTKWSEIAPAHNALTVKTPDGKRHAAVVTGVYKEHDLAIVKCDATLTPVQWAASTKPKLGEFIALANSDSEAEGLGVVSVMPRSLREGDKAYLGVMMDFSASGKKGTPLTRVIDSSAASKAGLRAGDVITTIDHTKIQGALEMKNMLQRLVPGSEIEIRYRRNGNEHKTKVLLGSRDETNDVRRVPRARMSRMERMGAIPSKVRSNFPSVIQSDMAIDPNDAGGPVVDLDGNIIGISIARGSRIKTFIIPSETVLKVLETKPAAYSKDLASKLEKINGNTDSKLPRRRVDARVRGDNYGQELLSLLKLLSEIERNNEDNQAHIQELKDALRELQGK